VEPIALRRSAQRALVPLRPIHRDRERDSDTLYRVLHLVEIARYVSAPAADTRSRPLLEHFEIVAKRRQLLVG